MVEAAAASSVTVYEDEGPGIEGTTNYKLDSGNGLKLTLLAYGATLYSLKFKNKEGVMEEVTLMRDNFEDICNRDKNPYYGATCGRVAGRIGGAKFTLGEGENAVEHRLPVNNGNACLHGGVMGYDRHEWEAEIVNGKKLSDFTPLADGVADVEGLSGVKFTRTSPHLEQEFPGALNVTSWYLINSDNKLIMAWDAEAASADCVTPVNLTNHTYWNLSGDFKDETIAAHQLSLTSQKVLTMSEESVPTGELADVSGTPFDFTDGFTALGDRGRLSGAIDAGGKPGIDHAFVVGGRADIDDTSFVRVGTLQHEASGRVMTLSTTQPAVVVYTGNYLPEDGSDGKHRQHAAVCLETCALNNAVNMLGTPGWPNKDSVLVTNAKPYHHVTLHEFSLTD